VEVTDESAEKVEKTNLTLIIHSENLNWKKHRKVARLADYKFCVTKSLRCMQQDLPNAREQDICRNDAGESRQPWEVR